MILMIPYRFILKYIFTDRELVAVSQGVEIFNNFCDLFVALQLDGAQAGLDLSGVRADDEEKDFYETAADCPIGPNTEAPLHR